MTAETAPDDYDTHVSAYLKMRAAIRRHVEDRPRALIFGEIPPEVVTDCEFKAAIEGIGAENA